MLSLLLPLLGILAGVGAARLFRPTTAAIAAILIPVTIFFLFAVSRAGVEILPHPGLWLLALTWALFVGVAYVLTRPLTQR